MNQNLRNYMDGYKCDLKEKEATIEEMLKSSDGLRCQLADNKKTIDNLLEERILDHATIKDLKSKLSRKPK